MADDKSKNLIKLGIRIKRVRSSKGKTLEKLAYEMGISKGNLSDIENGKRDARYTSLKSVAEGLEISISELLKDL